MSQTLKIASWNINSVRARMDIVTRFLNEEQPDILCLQETKVTDSIFPGGVFRQMGYNHQILHGQPMHHGVAIISRIPMREDDRLDWQANGEARHVGVRLDNGVRLENVYVPAGGEVPDRVENPKFGQKLDFIGRMIEWSKALDKPTILTGDFNIAPMECDVWNHKQLINVVSHTPVECELLAQLQAAHNWVDVGRMFHPAPKRLYTWWSYRAKDWEASDRGRRLDHIWASQGLKGALKSHRIVKKMRGWQKASDHVPVVVEFDI